MLVEIIHSEMIELYFYWMYNKWISFVSVSSAHAEDIKFLGPSWRKEPEDLILPIHSPEQEAVLTCEASGVPSPQYRYEPNLVFYANNLCILSLLLQTV